MIGLGLFALSKIGDIFGGGDETPPPPAKLPNAGSGIPQGWSPRTLAQQLFDVLDGATWTLPQKVKRDAVLLLLIQLQTADMFTAVYNDFTQNFGKGKTLRQWIDSEIGIDGSIMDELNIRFNLLGLKGRPMGSMYDYANNPNQQAFNWSQSNWKQQFVNAAGSLDNDLMINPNQPW